MMWDGYRLHALAFHRASALSALSQARHLERGIARNVDSCVKQISAKPILPSRMQHMHSHLPLARSKSQRWCEESHPLSPVDTFRRLPQAPWTTVKFVEAMKMMLYSAVPRKAFRVQFRSFLLFCFPTGRGDLEIKPVINPTHQDPNP